MPFLRLTRRQIQVLVVGALLLTGLITFGIIEIKNKIVDDMARVLTELLSKPPGM